MRKIHPFLLVLALLIPGLAVAETTRQNEETGFRAVIDDRGGLQDEAVYEGIFETIVLSSVCGLRKPGDAIYRLACDDMGIEPARCASVGDNLENDIPGAWRAGIGLNILYHSPEQRHIVPITDANRPDFEIWDFRELLHIFEA